MCGNFVLSLQVSQRRLCFKLNDGVHDKLEVLIFWKVQHFDDMHIVFIKT